MDALEQLNNRTGGKRRAFKMIKPDQLTGPAGVNGDFQTNVGFKVKRLRLAMTTRALHVALFNLVMR
jgi:hypothetical protein